MSKAKEKSAPRNPRLRGIAVAVMAAVISSGSGWAAPYVYPTGNQSNEQMEQDKYSCYQWAKGQTGVDPSQPAAAPQKKGGALRGAAGGAAAGAAVGAIAGNAGKGAAIGAASGGIIGGARKRRSEKAQEEQGQQQSAEYTRAWSACMEGKGYRVK